VYWLSFVLPGWGPRGFACEARPLPERTKMRESSRSNAAPVGYQPVGTNPSKRLWPRFETSTAATAVVAASAAARRPPPPEIATPSVVAPGGALGDSDTDTVSSARRSARPRIQTALVFAHATKSRPPSGDSTIALGCSPVAISPVFSRVLESKIEIRELPQSDT